MYLKFQNPGVAPIEALITVGVSLSRDRQEAIGQFGSGSAHAIAVCARFGCLPTIYLGRKKVSFEIDSRTLSDDVGEVKANFINIKHGGKTYPLGFSAELGQKDWTELHMGLREFTSNCLDQTAAKTQTYDDAVIEKVITPRARDNYTTVYVPWNPVVAEFLEQINKRFLFNKPASPILPKAGRTLNGTNGAMIYKDGVYIRQTKLPSIFDYSLDDLPIDECRNASDYNVSMEIGAIIGNDVEALKATLRACQIGESTIETEISSYDVMKVGRNKNFAQAFTECFGDNAVLCSELETVRQHVKNKGFDPISLPVGDWYRIMRQIDGVTTDVDILNKVESSGRELLPASQTMTDTVDSIWSLLTSFNMTSNKIKPQVCGFNSQMDASSQTWGIYEKNTVFLHKDLEGSMLYATALEEIVHHITGAIDGSRDLQEFSFRLVAAIAC